MADAQVVDSTAEDANDTKVKANSDVNEDDNLSGFEYMKKYYTCPKPYRRQQIAKNMIDIYGSIMGNKTSEDEFFNVFEALVNDTDVAVRTDTMEQAAKLATVLYAMSISEQFSHYGDYISRYILSSIYKLISDPGPQVRKASTIALVSLVENKILTEDQIVSEVLPLITEILDEDSNDDLRTECVSLLVRLATLSDPKLTLNHLIHKFKSLCKDQVFAVRKACALSMPQIIRIVGPEATESLLLPELKNLANDNVWGVRKISAESVTAFSEAVSPKLRREVLSPLYLNFLQDNSRWVKIAAFQNLGKFIATFADVSQSGVSLYRSDIDTDNPEVILHPEILSKLKRSNEDTSLQLRWATNVFWNVPPASIADLDLDETNEQQNSVTSGDREITSSSPDLNDEEPEHRKNYSKIDSGEGSVSGYGSMPFESANTSVSVGGAKTGATSTPDLQMTSQPSDDDSSVYTVRVAAPSSLGDEILDDDDDDLTGDNESVGGLDSKAMESIYKQKVVPPDILFQFVSMCDQKMAQSVDPELARHCAYSFPAIAFTLGRENWACLKSAYSTLSKDMSWKVRRSLAFSLHVMAQMLGPEIMMEDLLQVFDSFLNDLDDVKSGILRHFADFIRLLPAGQHREVYLGRLSGFIKPDNVRNWRFREDLAYQLTQLCDLYSSESVTRFIVPLTISLCSDRIAQVRQCSFYLVATIIAKFNRERAYDIANHFKSLLLDRFAKCSMFFGRLTFVQMCEVAMSQPSIEVPMFSKHYLPSLLALHADSVVNIRIALSRTLNSLYVVRPDFIEYKQPDSEWTIEDVIQILAHDSDRDVRSFCVTNEYLFASSFLNTSEDFDSTINPQTGNSTFIVSQADDTSESNRKSEQDSDKLQNPPPSPIQRHLKSVLDEIATGPMEEESQTLESSTTAGIDEDVSSSCQRNSDDEEVFLEDSPTTPDAPIPDPNAPSLAVAGDNEKTSAADEDDKNILVAAVTELTLSSEEKDSNNDQTADSLDSNC